MQNPGLEAFEKGRGNKDGFRGPDAALPTECFYILGYLLELIIKIWRFEKKFIKSWRIWFSFFMKNPLCRSKSYFSGRNLAKIRQSKKHWNLAGVWHYVIAAGETAKDVISVNARWEVAREVGSRRSRRRRCTVNKTLSIMEVSKKVPKKMLGDIGRLCFILLFPRFLSSFVKCCNQTSFVADGFLFSSHFS